MDTTLSLTNVCKDFRTKAGRVIAVDQVSTTIPAGQIVSLLGPNGAGKTTLLDIILGLSRPTSGTVTIGSHSPTEAIAAGHISALLQTGGLIKDMSVKETLAYIAATYTHRISTERVTHVVEQTDLGTLLGRKIGKLSGGEQQRVKCALALLSDPRILILDEPTTGMDVNARRAFWDTMRVQTHSGRTIIFATHYLEEAENFADRIILMNRGRIIADGSTSHIRSLAGMRQITASIEHADPQVIDALVSSEHATIQGSELRCATNSSDSIALQLLNAGATHLTITAPSLDDTFSSLVAADTDMKEA